MRIDEGEGEQPRETDRMEDSAQTGDRERDTEGEGRERGGRKRKGNEKHLNCYRQRSAGCTSVREGSKMPCRKYHRPLKSRARGRGLGGMCGCGHRGDLCRGRKVGRGCSIVLRLKSHMLYILERANYIKL